MSASRSRTSVRARFTPGGSPIPEPPDSSFWLERTPLPTPRRADPARSSRAAFAPPGTVCPKCDSPLSPSEPACPSCGLRRVMFGRFRAGAADRVPAQLELLWRDVEAQWADPALHERFMAQVSLCGAYAYAASRYRRAAKQRQSDAIANLQLERLSRMVHAVMAVSSVRAAEERGARPYRGLIVLLVFLVGLGAFGAIYLFHRRSARTQETIDRVPSSIKVRRGQSLGPNGGPAEAFGGLRAAKGKGKGKGTIKGKRGAASGDAGTAQADGTDPADEADKTDETDEADDESRTDRGAQDE